MAAFDIIFISYLESNAQANWEALTARFPTAKRVHGVKGIDAAHAKAKELSSTHFFFVVDGDNQIRPDFEFQVKGLEPCEDTLYVWRAENPVNGLIYGYGAIKLYNKILLSKNLDSNFVDLATSVPTRYCVIEEVASETHFHGTPEEAWRGAFREAAKLAALLIKDPTQGQAADRLDTWCNVSKSVENSAWVIAGAKEGRAFARDHFSQLHLINDFKWLQEKFMARSDSQKY